jgi:hypothetical protein
MSGCIRASSVGHSVVRPMADQLIRLTDERIDELQSLKTLVKFAPEGLYQAPTDSIQQASAAHIDALLDRLLVGLAQNPTKFYVLGEFKSTLKEFDLADSEEQDRALVYLENILDVLGIESSDGLLNMWRYGFDPSAKI